MLVLVRSFSYIPDASFSAEFRLPCLMRSFSYTPDASFREEFSYILQAMFGEEFLLHS